MEDDVYKGMFIPKGSLVFGNIWYAVFVLGPVQLIFNLCRAMLRDENLYPDPESFKPERFLEKATPEIERKRNPREIVFGFGRRCVFIFVFFANG